MHNYVTKGFLASQDYIKPLDTLQQQQQDLCIASTAVQGAPLSASCNHTGAISVPKEKELLVPWCTQVHGALIQCLPASDQACVVVCAPSCSLLCLTEVSVAPSLSRVTQCPSKKNPFAQKWQGEVPYCVGISGSNRPIHYLDDWGSYRSLYLEGPVSPVALAYGGLSMSYGVQLWCTDPCHLFATPWRGWGGDYIVPYPWTWCPCTRCRPCHIMSGDSASGALEPELIVWG